MNLRRLGRLSSTICVLLLLVATTLDLKALAEEASVKITSDTDCLFVVDGKPTARLQRGIPKNIELITGTRRLSAVSTDGDLWESDLDVESPTNPPVAIPLQEIKAKRMAAQENVAALQGTVNALQQKLTAVEQQNQKALQNEEGVRHERVLIVQAVNYYADRYGTELGLQGERHATSEQLMQNAAINTMSQNTYTQMAGLAELGISAWMSHKAHRNGKVAHAAALRMNDLEAALKDPLNQPRSPEQTSYLVMVRKTYDGKRRVS